MNPVASETIYSLLRNPATAPAHRGVWGLLSVIGALAWLGSVAFLGDYRPNEVSRALTAIMPSAGWYWGAVAGLAVLAALGRARGDRGVLVGAVVTLAFLLGNQLYRVVVPLLSANFDVPWRDAADAAGFMRLRLAWGFCLSLTMYIAWALLRERSGLRLGPGDLSAPGRETSMSRAPEPWRRQLLTGYGVFVLILLLLLQFSVGFRPVTGGALWPLLPLIVAASFANAASEEYVFRGLLMPALIRVGGVGAGLWTQGAVFGLMHWGLSVGVLAALPVSLGIGFGSVIWGKAALDTGGMLWVVLAHAMIDVAVMAAYFVP